MLGVSFFARALCTDSGLKFAKQESDLMEWALIVTGGSLAAIIVFNIGFFFGVRANNRRYPAAYSQMLGIYLNAVRREIANALMVRDHNRFVQTTIQALSEITRIKALTDSEARNEKTDFENKYEFVEDFTPFTVLEHVFYADAARDMSYEKLEDRYLDMVRYSAIMELRLGALDIALWLPRELHLEHLIEYAKRIDDTLLKRRVKQALSEYYKYGQGLDEFITSKFKIKKLWHHIENRFGIHFTMSDEYVSFSTYYFDDGDRLDTYYRSDVYFQTEQVLAFCDVTLPYEM